MRVRWPFALLCVVPMVTAGDSSAATVAIEPDPDPESSADVLVYRADSGERNALTAHVELRDGQEVWTLNDAGAIIVAPPTCASVDVHTVRCTPRPERYTDLADVDLGDGDDRFESSSSGSDEQFGNVIVSGGSGDDTLRASNSHNTLFGGDGNDVLALRGSGDVNRLDGGPGDDRLFGSRRFDELNGGGGRDALYGRGEGDIMTDGDRDGAAGNAGPGPDLFVGGAKGSCCLIVPGDRVSYRGRSEPVFVDLADDKPDGEAGEGDVLVGIESVEGGRAADRLFGDGRRNSLIGRRGADLLVGRGHSDTLMPGRGDDRVFCAAGGQDRAGPTDISDRLGRGCEVLDGGDLGIYSLPVHTRQAGPAALVYAVTCPESTRDDSSPYERCSATVHLREASGAQRLLGTGSSPWGMWTGQDVRIDLTSLGRRLIARRRGVLTTIRLGIRIHDGGETLTRTERWTIRLRD